MLIKSATQLFHSCSDSKDFVLGRKRGREERSEGEREGERFLVFVQEDLFSIQSLHPWYCSFHKLKYTK